MKCLSCKKEHNGAYGSGKYCSRSCANRRNHSEEVKQKIREGYYRSEWWLRKDFSHNADPEKIKKTKESWKQKRNYEEAHIDSIKRWLKEDRRSKCESCGNGIWLGEPIKLEVDHIDGDKTNNSLDNLRVLCPNCHSMTPTWRKKKRV